MESKAKIFGHAIHPIMIVFPLGLLATAVIFDILYLATANRTWSTVSFWMIAAGIIGGLLAAVFGLIDYLYIPAGTRAKRIKTLSRAGERHRDSSVCAELDVALECAGYPSDTCVALIVRGRSGRTRRWLAWR